jgi:hypothetical protein
MRTSGLVVSDGPDFLGVAAEKAFCTMSRKTVLISRAVLSLFDEKADEGRRISDSVRNGTWRSRRMRFNT